MSFCDVPSPLVGRCAFLHRPWPTALRIASRNGRRFGALPSLVIGMYGVMMLITMSNCASFGACAMVCESPQPKASMSRLSRAMLDLAGDGRAVDAGDQACARSARSWPPTPRPRTGFRPTARSSRTRRSPTTWRTHESGEGIWTDSAEPIRLHRAGIVARGLQQLVGLLAGDVLADARGRVLQRRRSPRPCRRCSRRDSRSARAPACRRWRRAARETATASYHHGEDLPAVGRSAAPDGMASLRP